MSQKSSLEIDDILAARVAALHKREKGSAGSVWLSGAQSYLFPGLTFVGILALWQAITVLMEVPRFLLPPPSVIVREMVVQQSLLMDHSMSTLTAILSGYSLAIAVAFPLATLITYSRMFERTVYPLLVATQTVPKVAIAPLFVVWFGFGILPKVVVSFLIAFFPIVIATAVGLKSTPREMIHLLRCMGANELQVFIRARFPYALPNIFGGLRIGIILAVTGAIVGEFVGADAGLGYLIQVSRGVFDTPLLFAALGQLSLFGISLFLIVWALESYVLSSRRGNVE